jgi:hypothetical protein
MDEIKDLKEVVKTKLGDKYTEEIGTLLGDEKVLLDAKNFVPLSKLEKESGLVKNLNEQLEAKEKTLQEIIAQRDKDFSKLKKEAEGNPELVKQFEEKIEAHKAEKETLKAQAEEAKAKSLNDRIHYILLTQLHDAGVNDPDARETFALKIERKAEGKLILDENEKIKSFDDHFKPIKENPAYASSIGTTVARGQRHNDGENDLNAEALSKNPWNKKNFNLTEQIRITKEDPTLAKKLKASAT